MYLKDGPLVQEGGEEGHEVSGYLADIRGVRIIIRDIAVTCANWVVHK